MSYPPTAHPRGGPAMGHPDPAVPAAPPKKPGVLVALLVTTVLAALSGALGSLLVYAGGKDLADENVRNAVDSEPDLVGLPAGTTSADIKHVTGSLWDQVVSDWQGTMSARATIALVFAVGLLIFALGARSGALWARVLITVTVPIALCFPHALILRDAAPTGLAATSTGAIVLGLAALVLCWLPPVGRYKKARRAAG